MTMAHFLNPDYQKEIFLENRVELHILLLTPNGEQGARLLEVLETRVPKNRIEVYGNIEGLTSRLRVPESSTVIAVLLALTEEELLRIVGINRLLSDLRLILILPNRDDRTVAMGHALHPRFLSYADADFRVVGAVLTKMMGRITRRARADGQGGVNDSEARNTFEGYGPHTKICS
jgi:hypothetical protein